MILTKGNNSLLHDMLKCQLILPGLINTLHISYFGLFLILTLGLLYAITSSDQRPLL